MTAAKSKEKDSREPEARKDAESVSGESKGAADSGDQGTAEDLEGRREAGGRSKQGGGPWGFVHRWSAAKLTLVVVLALATLYVPLAGSYGLWDPWETHYGEVSRSILQRNDPISPFWQDKWFWSKPIFTFWLQSFGMRVMGVNRMDSPPSEMALSSRPEWGMRLPIVLLSLLCLWILFHVIRRLLGRRTALLSVVICATSPLYAFTTRQSITDIPLVAPMTAALALILLAFFTDRDEKAPVLEWLRPWMLIPGVLFFMVLLFPGQDPMSRFHVPPLMLALHLVVGAAAVTFNVRHFKSLRDSKEKASHKMGEPAPLLYFLPLVAEVVVTGVGLLVWGPHVLNWSLPLLVALAFGNVELLRGERVDVSLWHLFGLILGGITCLQIVFFGAFIGRDFHKILVLGGSLRLNFYGWIYMLPWLALWVFYMVSTVSTKVREARFVYVHAAWLLSALAVLAKGLGGLAIPIAVVGLFVLLTRRWRLIMCLDLPRGLAIWFAVAAPWHHAMWIRHGKGFWNEYFGHHHFKRAQSGVHGQRGALDYFTAQLGYGMFPWSALIPASVLRWATRPTERDQRGQVQLFVAVWAGLCFSLFAIMETKFHHYILPAIPPMSILIAMWLDELVDRKDAGVVVSVLASLGLLALLGRDLIRDPQHLVSLFIYKYDRLFPYEVGFETGLALLTLATAVPLGLLLFKKLRPYAVWGLVAAGFLFGFWLLDFYMYKLSPHWGQKELHAAYHKARKGPEERLIAWELNWRGENFYTKNRVVVHMQPKDVNKFKAYLKRYTGETFYIILEAGRFDKLRRTLPTARAKETLEIVGPEGEAWPDGWERHYRDNRFKVLKKPYMSNKFLLVRTTI